MSKIWREEESSGIHPYDFLSGFSVMEEEPEEEPLEASKPEEEPSRPAKMTREEILRQAEEEAKAILHDAREQAELLRQEAYDEGKKEGTSQGMSQAYEEHRQHLKEELRQFQREFADVLQSVTIEKEKILEKYVDDLKRVSLAVAEKVIQTSLQSSGDIIKRMILAATDKMKKRQWAKIYVTKAQTGIALDVDAEFLERLASLSDNLKIVTMDNGEEGTCIIELPDEIVDASVGTQLENIKDILNNARV